MKILICIACESGAGPQISLGQTLVTLDPEARLTLLHVLGRGGDEDEARACLASARRDLTGGEIETKVRRGDPLSEIAAEVEESAADLVLLGPNDAHRSGTRMLESVTMQVILRLPCSVLVAHQTAGSILERILICSGGADVADDVIKTGAWIAQGLGGSATLLHVVTPVPSVYPGVLDSEEPLTQLLQMDTPVAHHLRNGAQIIEQHQVPAEIKLRYGVISDSIVREALKGNHGLIVLGAARGRAAVKRPMLGDVTEQVVERAPRPVLIVRERLGDTL
jgi:nucleotide-binding universal stress UspA family protein